MQSQYRNVVWYPRTGKWLVSVHLRCYGSERRVHVGYFDEEREAARVADLANAAIRGPAAGPPNLPDDPISGPMRSHWLQTLYEKRAIDLEQFREALRQSS